MRGLVSVIMPVYNAASYVEQAIRSVIDQTWPHWELLVVNDGSTDNSLERIRTFDDPRIRIIDQKTNNGVSAARNFGLRKMRGDFFCFLDADDVLPPSSIESRLRIFNDQVAFADGAVDVYDASLERRIGHWLPSVQGKVLKRLFHLDGSCFFGLTWMIRRQAQIQYKFDETLTHCEDLLFFMTVAEAGEYAYTDDVILRYRNNSTSAMNNSKGLGNGYTALRRKMSELFSLQISLFDKLVFDVKVRKIMFLTFLRENRLFPAIWYLLSGKSYR